MGDAWGDAWGMHGGMHGASWGPPKYRSGPAFMHALVALTIPSPRWVSPLDQVVLDDPVEDRVVVVPLEAHLNKVPACLHGACSSMIMIIHIIV